MKALSISFQRNEPPEAIGASVELARLHHGAVVHLGHAQCGPPLLLAHQLQLAHCTHLSKMLPVHHTSPPPLLPHGKLKYVLFWGGFSSQSLLGSSHNPWSASAAFGNSIWSASTESSLHPYSPAVNSPTLTDPLDPSPAPSADMSRTYNPWSMWRPTLGRRSSEPWPSPSEDAN